MSISTLIGDFHFLRPGWLWGLLLLPLLFRAFRQTEAGRHDWTAHVDAALRPFVLREVGSKGSRGLRQLAVTLSILTLIALAGPTWERLPAPAYRNLAPLVIVLDLSNLMDVQDLKPSRMERARYKIDDLLAARKDGQTALVAYADDAYVVTPLTDDVATIRAQLNALSPGIMPAPGSQLSLGLLRGAALMVQAGQARGDLLVVTAGAMDAASRQTADSLRSAGLRISVIGVGTPEGAPIPLSGGGFRRGAGGGLDIARLDVKALWDLAQAGGGLYRTLDAEGTRDEAAVLDFLGAHAAIDAQGETAHEVNQWREGGVYLLPVLLLLFAALFRRGWLAMALLVLLGAPVDRARADFFEGLWATPDQKGQSAFTAGDFERAHEAFENPDWRAAAAFRSGDFKGAAQDFKAASGPFADYNLANALAKSGQLQEALKAYDDQLKKTPEDEDTRYNKALVEEALKKASEPPQKENPKDDGDQKNPNQAQNKSQGKGKDKDKDKNNPQDKGKDPSKDKGQDPENDQAPKDQPQGSGPNDSPPKKGSPKDDPASNPSEPKDSPSQGANPPEKSPPPSGGEAPGTPPPEAGEAKNPPPPEPPTGGGEPQAPGEHEQSSAQWLRRIPDDPGGLLRRKFLYQSKARQKAGESP